MKNIDLKEKFQQYFNEQEGFCLRSERFYADIEAQRLMEDAAMAKAIKLIKEKYNI